MGKRGPQPTPTAVLEKRGSWRAKQRKKTAAAAARPSPIIPSVEAVPIFDVNESIKMVPGYDPFVGAAEYYFDAIAAERAIRFFHEELTHVKGVKARSPFYLEQWQQAIVANLFGWKHKTTDLRRYRKLGEWIPRKNGKSPFAAGIIVYILFEDGEPGAEVYGAASEYQQASLVFAHARGMVANNPRLLDKCKIYAGQAKAIQLDEDWSTYRVVSSDAMSAHGWNTHAGVVDELHTQVNRELLDALNTSTAARLQPLIITLTTADYDRESICNEEYDYAVKVRDGAIDDPTYLPVIYEASRDDDWKDPATWRKANPNLGVSVSLDYIERECQKAIDRPTYENTFKRLHLNIRTTQCNAWRALDDWLATDEGVDPIAWRAEQLEALKGSRCIAGFDLSQTRDITALSMLFITGEQEYTVVPWFWIPGESADVNERRDRVPYATWARQGFVEMTDGNSVDYDRVRDVLNVLRTDYDIVEVAGDPYNAMQLSHDLMADGFQVVHVRQAMISMSPGTKEFDRLAARHRIHHGQNPVLKWMASNVEIDQDRRENIMPKKASERARIDGIAATIIALTRAMAIEPAFTPGVYAL